MIPEDSLLRVVSRTRSQSTGTVTLPDVVGYGMVKLMEVLVPVKTVTGLPLPVLENPLLFKHVWVDDFDRNDVIHFFQ